MTQIIKFLWLHASNLDRLSGIKFNNTDYITYLPMIKCFTIALLIALNAFPAMATTAKVYVWRNESGVLVFSDSPRAGAEEVKLKPENTSIPSMNIETDLLDITPKVIDNNFQVVITQPENNATIRDNTGSIYISGAVKPLFKRGNKVQLFLDNKPYKTPQTHSMFSLRDIDRGEHQIKINLLDDKGKIIASSDKVTFYMHRVSVN